MTDHQINKILAAVAGVDVWNHHDIRTSLDVWTDGYRLWTPLTDHNQMALVKAGLREQNVGHAIVDRGSFYHVTLWRLPSIEGDPLAVETGPDELRAFALAVWDMRQAQGHIMIERKENK
jgi:hypothetical protein